jgi:ADP-heptose:LPS heptosyltransferase
MSEERILLIRMQSEIECFTIGTPALLHLSRLFPQAEIDFLTYNMPKDLATMLPKNVHLFELSTPIWPDQILPAMEWFFEIAADIVKKEYSSIINLDTAFMPCMLARFLQDAGEPVVGNKINMDVQQVIAKLVDHTLSPEYVNEMPQYLTSSFVGMNRWRQFWWQSGVEVKYGYPEYYLRNCCGFDELDYSLTLDVEANHSLVKVAKNQKVIALSEGHDEKTKILMQDVAKMLVKKDFHVWSISLENDKYLKTAKKLKASLLAVTFSEPAFWLAKAVECKTLLLCEGVEPVTLMPEYSTEPNQQLEAAQLVDDILGLFSDMNNAVSVH